MITRIVEWSAAHRITVVLVCLAASIGGWWSMRRVPLDALPDLSDVQVIVYSRWDRSAEVVEDQVTSPIVAALIGAPRVKAVRGVSDFGASFVYVIFDDRTDIYWARTRTLEYLSPVLSRLPPGVSTELGPDATGLGWVFQYVLVDDSGTHSLADLRSIQDWYIRLQLKSVPGVADVASVGGHVRQYQVTVDPHRLRAYALPIGKVVDAVRSGNSDASGRVIEASGAEYTIRAHGYARSVADLENIVLTTDKRGQPVRIRDVGHVGVGPDQRRGVVDLDGRGDAVSGIVIMRTGENALRVIRGVKERIRDMASGLPSGVRVVPVYDRSMLIERSIDTLKGSLIEIVATVALVIVLFLGVVPSALIPVITMPVAVLIAFVPFRALGLTADIMSLGGIAIAVGALVDSSIVIVEQTHKRLETLSSAADREMRSRVVLAAIKEVATPAFFALLVIAVSFLPVLTLTDQEGRLFRPLAYTKTLCIVVGALLAITLDPALRVWLTAGRVRAESAHRISRTLMAAYRPIAAASLRQPWAGVVLACALMAATVPIFMRLGSELMPPLDEGTLLYMPSTPPGISIADAERLLQVSDRIIKQFPEVDRVLGKAGRADTPTDPAPLSMLETIITLKPASEWRRVPTWYSSWAPEWLLPALRRITADRVSSAELVRQMNEALEIPGVANAWTMPVKARTTMLATGIRTPLGLKIAGDNVGVLDEIGSRIESLLARVPGTRSVFAERLNGGRFIDVDWNRAELARYGLSIDDAQSVVQYAIGGENVTTTIEGRARYPVNVRYLADYRRDIEALARLPVVTPGGQPVRLEQLASIREQIGPSMVRNENGLLTSYVYVDLAGRDAGRYIADAQPLLAAGLRLPAGYSVTWSGDYEQMRQTGERLMFVVPLTFALVVLLLWINTRSLARTAMVLLAVPFSAIGAVWLLYLLGYDMSVGVWVGLIALVGVDAETGVFMLLYLDLTCAEARAAGRLGSRLELREAVMNGAVRRLRPKFMTAATMCIGLVPLLWASGTGADVMKRIAAPLVGGIVTSFLLELLIYPPLYELWRWHADVKRRI